MSEFLTAQVFSYLLVFARIGSAFAFIPGLGEASVPQRIRLVMALAVSLVISVSMPSYTPPAHVLDVLRLIAMEVTIGVWIGVVARVLMNSLQVAGALGGQLSALANAFGAGIGSFEGATVMSSFLLIGGLAAIFVTDLHHLIILALKSSYYLMPMGVVHWEDISQQTARAVMASFAAGFSMASPFMMIGILINVSLGLVNKMMPSLPVFFVATSVLIGLGILVLGLAAPMIIRHFLSFFGDWLMQLRFD